jgi:gliding motility-associated-like protein
MKQAKQYILLIALLWGHILPILAQCPSDLLFIKAPESICANSKELVLRTSKAKESNVQYVWKMPSGDTITTDSVLVIKKPQPIHSGKYSVFTRIGTCSSTPVGALEVTILGLPTLTVEPLKQIKLCGIKDTTLTSKLKISNGITGEWFAAEEVEVTQRNSEKTAVKNLRVGENLFVWILSTDKCPNFAKDSFKVNVEVAPSLVSQDFTLDARNATLTLPLGTVRGSNIDLISEIAIRIGKEPKSSGTIDTSGKNLKYTRKPGFFGLDKFSFVVCNKRCPNLCSSPSTFEINVEFNDQYPSITVPKLLSKSNPKGLVIENVDTYIENELLIIDRWGGVVEKIPNYNTKDKAWDGTRAGKPLPSGAYYVVFYAKRDNNTPPRTDFKPVSSIFYIIE